MLDLLHEHVAFLSIVDANFKLAGPVKSVFVWYQFHLLIL